MDWREKEAARNREKIETETYDIDGVKYWKTNDSPVPYWVYDEAGLDCPEIQREAHDRHVGESIAEYREQMKNHVYSEEELFEMRAAFGPGVTVVNVLTGKKVTL